MGRDVGVSFIPIVYYYNYNWSREIIAYFINGSLGPISGATDIDGPVHGLTRLYVCNTVYFMETRQNQKPLSPSVPQHLDGFLAPDGVLFKRING